MSRTLPHLPLAVAIAAALAFAMSGCMPAKPPAGDKPKTAEAGHEHDHPATGPHKGQLIELGAEEYHAELVHDDKANKITIYVLDSKAAKSVPIAETQIVLNLVVIGKPMQYTLPALPQEGDPAGQSSRFESSDRTLGDALDDENTKGRLNVTIAGKPFVGEFQHGGEAGHHH